MAKYNSLDEVPADLISKLSTYFSTPTGDTFVIKNLPPELTGGLLARYSRAPYSLRLTLLNEFLDESGNPSAQKGSELMDRVLNAFGDDSVGELEGAHVGFERVSQLLTKVIEDKRIGGSPIEQSTRYVRYDQRDKQGNWPYLRPQGIREAGFLPQFESLCDSAFDIYSRAVPLISEIFKRQLPESEFEIEVERDSRKTKVKKSDLKSDIEAKAFKTAYAFTIRCAALDVSRCVLPASTLTQLGLYGNGRYFANLITALKSSNLYEAQSKGNDLEEQLKTHIPTFIKRAKADPRKEERDNDMYLLASNLINSSKIPEAENAKVTLLLPRDIETAFLCDTLFPYTNLSVNQINHIVTRLHPEEKTKIIETYVGVRDSRRNRTGRAAETGYPFTFEIVGGFAEYRDLERHRMMTQQRQLLTTKLGFEIPFEIAEVGLTSEVEDLIGKSNEIYTTLNIAELRGEAQYATLFNHQIRFMMGMNLRELQHLTELRSQPAGHFSYRAVAQEMARQAITSNPWIAPMLNHINYSDPGNKIARAKEQGRIAGKNLKTGVDGAQDLEE